MVRQARKLIVLLCAVVAPATFAKDQPKTKAAAARCTNAKAAKSSFDITCSSTLRTDYKMSGKTSQYDFDEVAARKLCACLLDIIDWSKFVDTGDFADAECNVDATNFYKVADIFAVKCGATEDTMVRRK